ncbi:FAM172 family protein homolog CG10038 [Teleopsis dalmanni]|uniref:FAM172 family protein homolog CG10038 n=1 Tax=Teleopsis dalmanni TaxID=139649 RepID=UPI0018CE1453|nr:FAM172 family protein homolog CG10038 [Teleopsis dalmanni]
MLSFFRRFSKLIVAAEMSSNKSKALEKLREFGYAFNKSGQLRKIDPETGEAGMEGFVFNVYKEQEKNQARYEQLAEQIPDIVYDLLEQNGMTRIYIPDNLPPERQTCIFTQPKNLRRSQKLIVLIHGSGYVRAGQWARSLIINNSIDHGTQIPYIKQAKSLGYDILITNTNDNYRIIDGVKKSVSGLSTPSDHAAYVWENFVISSNPESVAIVAHSAGGGVTIELARRFPDFFKQKVFGVAFTDSAHFGMPSELQQLLSDKACNWVSSNQPLDKVLTTFKNDLPCRSAGHGQHEWTSYTAIDAVFKYLEEKFEQFTIDKKQ